MLTTVQHLQQRTIIQPTLLHQRATLSIRLHRLPHHHPLTFSHPFPLHPLHRQSSRTTLLETINSRFGFRDRLTKEKKTKKKSMSRKPNATKQYCDAAATAIDDDKETRMKTIECVCVFICACVFLCLCSNLFSYVLQCVQWILYTLPHRCSLLHHSFIF